MPAIRDDCNVDPGERVRLPNIPVGSAGRNAYAARGDFVRWTAPASKDTCTGRVIGIVHAPDIHGPQLCVALLFGGLCAERWVDPADVYDCFTWVSLDKMTWFYGPQFIATPVDKARQCFELTVEEMMSQQPLPSRNDPPQRVVEID